MLTMVGVRYGKKIYPDWFLADIVRRMHEDHTLTTGGLYRLLLAEQAISPEFKEWQIETLVNSNPRFRYMFIQKYGAEAHRAWKGRLKTASLSAQRESKPPMDFSRFHPLAVALAIHPKKLQVARTQETDEEEDDD